MTEAVDRNNHSATKRVQLDLKWGDFKWPLMFLLSMSLMGLQFPLGYLFVLLLLFNRFNNDKYDFIIMLTIFFGGYGFTAEGSFPFKMNDVALVVSFIIILIYRKTGPVKSAFYLLLGYIGVTFLIAMLSEETLTIQFRTMRNLYLFAFFIVPIACFSQAKFDIAVFMRKLMPYVLIIASFYVIDGFLIGGFVLLPRTSLWGEYAQSYFYNPIVFGLFTVVRKYPEGLVFLALGIYPIARHYKLRWWQWVVLIGGCAASQTFTVISGLVVGYIVARGALKKLFIYVFAIPVVFGLVYFIDGLLPVTHSEFRDQSFLRVKSSIDQIVSLTEAVDDVDIADFGSGRMGQALPKIELVQELGRQWIGLGYLHPQLTTNPKYIIYNEYYKNTEESEEVATQLIETEVLQTYVTSGWIGLIALIAFYVATYFIIRRFDYSRYYLSVLVMIFWFGMGAYGGLTTHYGLLLLSLAYSAVILHHRDNCRDSRDS